MSQPQFIATDTGFVLQERGPDDNYRMVARVAGGQAERLAALLNVGVAFYDEGEDA